MRELAKKMEEEGKESINQLFMADLDISDEDEESDGENGDKSSSPKGSSLKSPPKHSRSIYECVPVIKLEKVDSGRNGNGSNKPL